MEIYYEDSYIIVCEKPYGVSSQLSGAENMVSLLTQHVGSEVYCVHRLDTQTTGVMVYAKNSESAAILSEQIAQRAFEKEYLCVCHGTLEDYGEMTDILYHDKLKNKSFVVDTKRRGAKEAKLEFWTQGRSKNGEKELSLVKILLHTGRTHQIRVQLASRKNMLYGDGKYGAKDNDKIALHSNRIKFYHPKSKKQMEFCSLPTGKIWELFTL